MEIPIEILDPHNKTALNVIYIYLSDFQETWEFIGLYSPQSSPLYNPLPFRHLAGGENP